ncbi:MAG TPA: C4-type zinc ribbon domain-containing protein [Candidatus Acidoferrales bacterium]|nr:C4-type zinc ribbon domain-containing protein [Candidatus Acidoferrales bacterium]
MREQIEVLASLQSIDREIKERTQAKQSILAEIQRWQSQIEAKKAEAERRRLEWEERERLRQEKERVLQEENAKAVEKRMRMNRIKNIKELQALQREIEQIKQSNSALEEELLKMMEELDGSASSLSQNESECKALEEEWNARQGELQAELQRIESDIAEFSRQRQTLAARLNGDLIGRYELIFSRRGGTAVVAVVDGICQGCYMNIPPQLYNEILKGERLHLCPSCHRILFYRQPAGSDKQI